MIEEDMKNMNIIRIMSAALLSMAFVSCSFLDFDETDGLKTKEDM